MAEHESSVEVVKNDVKNIVTMVGDIKEHLRTLNGRTRKSEIWIARVIGFCTCISLLILPILLAIVNAWINKSFS